MKKKLTLLFATAILLACHATMASPQTDGKVLTAANPSVMPRNTSVFNDPPTYGDTISYCGNTAYSNSVGAGGALTWGIRIPAAMHSHRQFLTDVMLYVQYSGTYNLSIYQGSTTSTSTLSTTQTATFATSDQNMWNTIHLTSPIALDSTLPLWIVFSNNTISYPAAICNATGDTNGSLVTLDNGSTWYSLYSASGGSLDGSWMIRAILSGSGTPSISIAGPTETGVGIPTTFTVSGPVGATYSWQLNGATPDTATGSTATAIWNTPGSYDVTVATIWSGITLSDTLSVAVQSCLIDTFPYTMGFEPDESIACWQSIDQDGDGFGWGYTPFDSLGHNNSHSFASASYINGIGVLTPDNWLVTPPMQLTSGNEYTLTWYDGAVDSNYYDECYSVYVSTTGSSVSDFPSTPVFQTTLTTVSYTQRTVDLSSYAGQTIHIAFRHHNSTDIYWLQIDDIAVTETVPAPQEHTLTVLSADSTMGTVTGTGVWSHGTSITIAAFPYTGYHFVQWQDSNTLDHRPVIVTSDTTFTAYFAANMHFIYGISSNPTMGEVTGTGAYPYGSTVVLTAVPYEGYRFVQWDDADTTNPRTVTVADQDASYTATFQPIQTEGIENTEESGSITVLDGQVIRIAGAANRQIDIYDIAGRRICGTSNAAEGCQYTMPNPGVYLVSIEGSAVRRVVVIR